MSSGYRLAPALAARLVGLALVLLALLVLAGTVLIAVLGGPPTLLLAIGAGALVVVVALVVPLRQVRVVQLDDAGYRVRMVRGAGVRSARWDQVEDAVAASPHGVDCVVLRLKDGRTTSIPVAAVGAPREEFVADLRAHLRRGEGLRPL
ncbi:hypothetical protein [Nocardioides sp. GXQ0305]|uniref:hypothetical protein n=1 Tax=Nocardioides sp. GXQ0305 TaxID=3423912 RepID=UPI003D7D9956